MNQNSLSAAEPIPPYPPSWLDRLTTWVAHLSMPAPTCYALAALAAVGLFVLNDALHGQGLLYALRPFHIVVAVELIYAIALVDFLDREAARALAGIKPLLDCGPTDFDALRYRLTTIPARGALLAGLAGMSAGLVAVLVERIAAPRAFAMFILPGISRYFIEVWLVLTWFVFGSLFYHTYHQLRLISRIYTDHTRIDLDQYSPLFNFSRVSALTAIGLLALPYAWYATVPGLIREPIGIVFGALFPIFAIVSFISPLVGVHHLLVEAKERALAENAQALKVARLALYQRANAREIGGASELHDMLAALRSERDALERISTWPWQHETPRSVVAVLILPLLLWLIQWVLARLLGPGP